MSFQSFADAPNDGCRSSARSAAATASGWSTIRWCPASGTPTNGVPDGSVSRMKLIEPLSSTVLPLPVRMPRMLQMLLSSPYRTANGTPARVADSVDAILKV